jgi:hypothetical protein
VSDESREPFRIRDHIGVMSGLFLGAIAFVLVLALAVKGFEPAITLLVVIVAFFGLIALGTRMRG